MFEQTGLFAIFVPDSKDTFFRLISDVTSWRYCVHPVILKPCKSLAMSINKQELIGKIHQIEGLNYPITIQ